MTIFHDECDAEYRNTGAKSTTELTCVLFVGVRSWLALTGALVSPSCLALAQKNLGRKNCEHLEEVGQFTIEFREDSFRGILLFGAAEGFILVREVPN